MRARQLAATRPGEFTFEVAGALNHMCLPLSDLGRREDALAAIKEAVSAPVILSSRSASPGTGAPSLAQPGACPPPVTLLLGTAVLLLPYNHPVVLAKQLATIDVLSRAG
jgi:hypothetical protein